MEYRDNFKVKTFTLANCPSPRSVILKQVQGTQSTDMKTNITAANKNGT